MTIDINNLECDTGWSELIEKLCGKLDETVPGWKLIQGKEKFGGLRFYIEAPQGWDSDEMLVAQALIDEAESESYTICEQCGAPGKPTNTYWIKTLCEMHTTERDERRKELYS